MPLVFVHGVAKRPSDEQKAEVEQRSALFRAITFRNDAVMVFNPDWGSNAVAFTESLPWLPTPEATSRPFAASEAALSDGTAREVGLGRIAKVDGAQAVDLPVLAALEEAVATGDPARAVDKELIALA